MTKIKKIDKKMGHRVKNTLIEMKNVSRDVQPAIIYSVIRNSTFNVFVSTVLNRKISPT